MSTSPDPSLNREERVNAAIASYLEALDRGCAPEEKAFLGRYPDLADELRLFLENRRCLAEAVSLPAPAPRLTTMFTAGAVQSASSVNRVKYFGGYEILNEIARGGMGVVYKARQVSLNRVVALKMILAGSFASPADVQRFRREAMAVAELDHPNIVPIYEIGEYEGQHYFSMKLIDGGSLADRVDELLAMPEKIAPLLIQVCQAVHLAHQHGILHRDLKPGNILIDANGTSYVTDFGLSRRMDASSAMTRSGAIVGTPSYMAPEQAAPRRDLSPAVDVWALGAILYELLTGRPPFQAATPLDVLINVLDREPEPPRKVNPPVDRDLETICLKCLAKDPRDRYDSAAMLAEDLSRSLTGDHPIHARPPSSWGALSRWAGKQPLTAILTFLAVSGSVLFYLMAVTHSLALNAQHVGSAVAMIPGFLCTMVILVRPRLTVVWRSTLILFLAVGLPWLGWAYLWPTGRTFAALGPATLLDPETLTYALALVYGTLPAAVLGGISRWIAQRYQCDMLSALYCGVTGAVMTGVLYSRLAFALSAIAGPRGSAKNSSSLEDLAMMLTPLFVLAGFCAGAMTFARISQRRPVSR
jgi:hypothetical protein